jgi:hypothetical protein
MNKTSTNQKTHTYLFKMKNVTLVYPLGRGSSWGNKELVYSIRSVEKHLKGVDSINIVLISDFVPEQLNVDKIKILHHTEKTNIAAKNILDKIFSNTKNFDSVFVLMNDDFYFNQDVHVDELLTTLYYDSTILNRWNKIAGVDLYGKSLFETKNLLDNFALPTLNFSVHFPIPIYTKCLPYIKNLIDDDRIQGNDRPLLFRCVYANYFKKYYNQIIDSSISEQIKFVNKPDLKLNKMMNYKGFVQTINNQNLFSIGDNLLLDAGVRLEFERLYSNKSKFEL